MQVTTYHVLWELVHVFFEQPGVLGPGGGDMTARCQALRPECHGEVCITCSDTAVAVTVRAAAGRRPGRGRHRRRQEEVSVALVSAAVGDTILVHAREAIAVVAGR